MTEAKTTPAGWEFYVAWPYLLVRDQYGWDYDYKYLGDADRVLCWCISIPGWGILPAALWGVIDLYFAPSEFWWIVKVDAFLLILYGILTVIRLRLRNASRKAMDSGRAMETQEWKRLLEFGLFPYYSTSTEGPTLIGVVAQLILVAAPLYQWFAVAPLSTPVFVSTVVISGVGFLFAYGLYRNPGFRDLRGKSCD